MATSTAYQKDPIGGDHKSVHDKPVDSTDPDKVVTAVDTPVSAERAGLTATIQDAAGFDPARADAAAALMLRNAGRTSRDTSLAAPQSGLMQLDAPGQINLEDQYLDQVTMEDANASGVGIGNTDVTTREITDDELVSHQLEGLLSEDSTYLRNARMRAMEEANARGTFGSSFKAGAAERAAMEAAMPIATADAQGYRDVATQNMNALNSMALANLQRATSLDTALLSANTQRAMANLDAGIRTSIANLDAMTKIDISNLDAATRTGIANMQAATQIRIQDMADTNARYMQGKQLTHETGLEQLRQQGRLELAALDDALQTKLARFAQDGRIDLENLSHENRMVLQQEINAHEAAENDKKIAAERKTERNNLAMQAELNYVNYVIAYANTDMDAAAARRLADDSWNRYSNTINIINTEYPELEPITATRMGAVTGTSDGKTGGKGDDGRANWRG